jgi:hypothetical protein
MTAAPIVITPKAASAASKPASASRSGLPSRKGVVAGTTFDCMIAQASSFPGHYRLLIR